MIEDDWWLMMTNVDNDVLLNSIFKVLLLEAIYAHA